MLRQLILLYELLHSIFSDLFVQDHVIIRIRLLLINLSNSVSARTLEASTVDVHLLKHKRFRWLSQLKRSFTAAGLIKQAASLSESDVGFQDLEDSL